MHSNRCSIYLHALPPPLEKVRSQGDSGFTPTNIHKKHLWTPVSDPTHRPALQDWSSLYKSICPKTIVNTLSFYSLDALLEVQGTLRRGKNNPPL